MDRKFDNIVTYSADELMSKIARGEDRTNRKAAALVSLPDGSDPADAMEEIAWATTELPLPRRKSHASLRIDAAVLDWFKGQGQGRGYQTRINAVLRRYYKSQAR